MAKKRKQTARLSVDDLFIHYRRAARRHAADRRVDETAVKNLTAAGGARRR